MAGRIISTLILIITLALVYLAPQGLLTKPVLEQDLRGPFILQVEGAIDATGAYLWAYDLGVQDTTLQAGGLPAVLNARMIAGPAEPVQFGMVHELADDLTPSETESSGSLVELPRDTYLIARFPNRGQFSGRFGAWKVYKGFQHEIMRRGLLPGPVLEIHEPGSEEIVYFLPFLIRDTQE